MSSRFINLLGLVVLVGFGSVLALNPRIVDSFFNGSAKLLSTALGGGRR